MAFHCDSTPVIRSRILVVCAERGLRAGGPAGAEYNGVVQFSSKREQRAELASIALLVLKILVYVAIAAGAVYLLIRPPVAY